MQYVVNIIVSLSSTSLSLWAKSDYRLAEESSGWEDSFDSMGQCHHV